MKVKSNTWLRTGLMAGTILAAACWAVAQNPPPPSPGAQNPPPAAAPDKAKTPANNSLSLDDPNAAPVNAEEDAAYKAIAGAPASDQAKKIELGEAFLQKHPNSRYRSSVYSALTIAYLQTGQVPKMEEVADKEIALNPNDVQVLAALASVRWPYGNIAPLSPVAFPVLESWRSSLAAGFAP